MNYLLKQLLGSDLIELTKEEENSLRHVVSYIYRYGLQEKYINSNLRQDFIFEKHYFYHPPTESVEDKYPQELKLLNKLMTLYTLSDNGG